MKNVKLYFKSLVVVSVFFTSCSTSESKIKELITAKENRVGNIVKNISILNMPEEKKSLFTITYTVTNPADETRQDSIQIAQTKDEILSEFIWETSAKD